jgi:mycothiol synthase
MQRPAEAPPVDCDLPTGFIIRPLNGEGEIEAYVELHRAVFESRNMTAEWRARTLRQPAYTPDLDLVAVALDGRLAAFCVCWLDENPGTGTIGQIEPLGVHASFRKSGLGRAILVEGLQRLQSHGASRICVEADNYRHAALDLYESVGFRIVRDILVYSKDYA